MFPFIYVCDLLERLWLLHHARLVYSDLRAKTESQITAWWRQHSRRLAEAQTDLDAVVRCLRPQKTQGWEYGLDAQRLQQIIARALALSQPRVQSLQQWQEASSRLDLAACVEIVMQDGVSYQHPYRHILVVTRGTRTTYHPFKASQLHVKKSHKH